MRERGSEAKTWSVHCSCEYAIKRVLDERCTLYFSSLAFAHSHPALMAKFHEKYFYPHDKIGSMTMNVTKQLAVALLRPGFL